LGIWNKVLILAAWGLILWISPWPLWINAATTACIAVIVYYLTYRERQGFKVEFVRGNLLYLMPGHVVLLFALSWIKQPVIALWWVWVALVAGTIAFDVTAQRAWPFEARRRAIVLLYVLVWSAIFFLLHQLIALGGNLDEGGWWALSWGLGLFGLAYIGLAVYRFSQLKPHQE